MSGTVLITGANGSLAIPAVQHLLKTYPTYTAILAVRNPSSSDPNTKRLNSIISKCHSSKASIRTLDLGSLSAVKAFATELKTDIQSKKIPPLSAIICNAFTWHINGGIQYTTDGYERSIGVNHLGHIALILHLLDSFQPAPHDCRIVFLGSEAHIPGRAGLEVFPPVLPEDLGKLVRPDEDEEGEGVGRGFWRYGVSKLANIMGMWELNRRLEKTPSLSHIHTLANDPGGLLNSRTWNEEHIPRAWHAMISVANMLQPVWKYFQPSMRRVEVAGAEIIEVAVGEKYAGKRGYFALGKESESSTQSRDEVLQKQLWDMCLVWCGIDQKDSPLQG